MSHYLLLCLANGGTGTLTPGGNWPLVTPALLRTLGGHLVGQEYNADGTLTTIERVELRRTETIDQQVTFWDRDGAEDDTPTTPAVDHTKDDIEALTQWRKHHPLYSTQLGEGHPG